MRRSKMVALAASRGCDAARCSEKVLLEDNLGLRGGGLLGGGGAQLARVTYRYGCPLPRTRAAEGCRKAAVLRIQWCRNPFGNGEFRPV